jgi:hypothetical protein
VSALVPSPQQIGPRFNLVSAIPTTTLVVFLGGLLLAGAPTHRPDPARAHERIAGLSVGEIALLALLVLALSLVLSPFQVGFVKFLEGYWPSARPFAWLAERLRERHAARWQRLEQSRVSHPERDDDAKLLTMPARERLLPTRLGNALRHAEDLAGSRYGLGTVQIVPRMWPVMPESMVAVIDDARNDMDVMASFVFVWLTATLVSFGLVCQYGVWLILPFVTLTLAGACYAGAVVAARSYGQTLVWAIDLYRFDLYRQLHIELPFSHADERRRNERLMPFLAGDWLAFDDQQPLWAPCYRHPPPQG